MCTTFYSLPFSIDPTTPTLFYMSIMKPSAQRSSHAAHVAPKKLEWIFESTPEFRAGIRFAETRLSDLIGQNDCAAMEFRGYGVAACQRFPSLVSRAIASVLLPLRRHNSDTALSIGRPSSVPNVRSLPTTRPFVAHGEKQISIRKVSCG